VCNATSLKRLRKNAKNENDVKTAARAQWLHERNKGAQQEFCTYLKRKPQLCCAQKDGFQALSHELVYKCKPRWCFWRNISPDLTVKLECEVWLRYEITANPSGALEEETWRRRREISTPLKLHEQISRVDITW